MRRPILALAALLLLAPAAHADSFQVDTEADVATPSWADCLDEDTGTPCSVRDALTAAAVSPGDDRVEVPAGRYVLGGAALETSGDGKVEIAGAGAAATTLDGNELSGVLVLMVDTTIEGVTIRDGRVPIFGGGILADQGALTLRDSVVESNHAGAQGGGIAIADGGATRIERSIVRENHANRAGGGILGADGSGPMTIVDSVIAANHAEPVSGGWAEGGGIVAWSKLTLERVAVLDNEAAATAVVDDGAAGGGVVAVAALGVIDSTFARNRATGRVGAEARGGALYVASSGAQMIRGTTFAGNSAAATGGQAQGGAIRQFFGGSLEIVNSTFSGNSVSATHDASAALGGAAMLETAATLMHVTLAGNTASGNGASGGSLWAPSAVLQRTIVAGGDCADPVAAASDSVDSGTTCGLNHSGVDPRLGPLAANGGLTETHALLPGSPAIDVATPPGPLLPDQRGVPRPQGAGVDAGAYEAVPEPEPEPPGGGPPPGGGGPSPPVGGAPPVPDVPPAADRTAPAFTSAPALARAAFRARAGLRFGLSEAATVELRVERRTVGRRVRGRCVRRTQRNRERRRCVRHVALAGRSTRPGTAGANRTVFAARVRGRALSPGRYRLVAVAVDAAGNRSAPARVPFRILGR